MKKRTAPRRRSSPPAIRKDGWGATIGRLPVANKIQGVLPYADALLNPQGLSVLWHYSDLAARIVKELPEHAMRQGFSFVREGEGQVDAAKKLQRAMVKKWGVHEHIVAADGWGRLFGGAFIFLGIVGAGLPEEPLDDTRVKKDSLKFLAVYDRRDVLPHTYYRNPLEQKFGAVESYRVRPVATGASPLPVNTFVIHETRLIRFGGALTAPLERVQNQGFDHSVLQRVFQALQETQSNWASIVGLMSDFGQAVYKLQNLIKLIAQKGGDAIEERIFQVDQARSSTRSIVLDAEKEDFERKATPVAGAADLLDRSWQRLAAAAEMPLTILMGTSPSGLNATGESDMRIWYDRVGEHREKIITPRLDRLKTIVALSEGISGTEELDIHWPSLWQPTDKEKAETHWMQAQADEKYIKNRVAMPSEIGTSRFGASGYSLETRVDLEMRVKLATVEAQQLLEPKPEPSAQPAPDNKPADDARADAAAHPMHHVERLLMASKALMNARRAGVDLHPTDVMRTAEVDVRAEREPEGER